METFWTLVSACAATLSALNVTPQLIRSLRTRRTADIAFPMLWIIMLGCSLWIAHGLRRGDLALVGANVVLLATTATLAVVKLRFDAPRRPPQGEGGSDLVS
jgi:MtN3 and saliva related transmembrane protein